MPLQILVVDDNELIRESVCRRIRILRPDADIATANNGFDAVKGIDNIHYDLVITDVDMPVMNGMDVLKHARKRSYKKSTTVFVMSANYGYKDEALSHGAEVFLEKSLNFIAKLGEYIQIHFSNKG